MNRGTLTWVLGVLTLICVAMAYVYIAEPWGPGQNGGWTRADHNGDGVVERGEMELFGNQKPHRNGPRLLMHFNAADTNQDGRVTQAEIDVYGMEIGSRDPMNRR